MRLVAQLVERLTMPDRIDLGHQHGRVAGGGRAFHDRNPRPGGHYGQRRLVLISLAQVLGEGRLVG